jgi:hypothetical protein
MSFLRHFFGLLLIFLMHTICIMLSEGQDGLHLMFIMISPACQQTRMHGKIAAFN